MVLLAVEMPSLNSKPYLLLTMLIEKFTLESRRIRLEPLALAHLPAIAEVIRDGELWLLDYTFVPHPDELEAYFANAETAFQEGRELAFATVDKDSNKIVGSTRFKNIDSRHKQAEIGATFIAQSQQRTYVNTEAKYLMLQQAFEVWQLNRIEFLTGVLNTRSRSAIARIGATQEGILRSHRVMRDGRLRDSVLFSIIGSDWPGVKAGLLDKIDKSAE